MLLQDFRATGSYLSAGSPVIYPDHVGRASSYHLPEGDAGVLALDIPRTNIVQRLIATDAVAVPLMLRLALSVVIFPHGMQKVFGWFGGSGFDATMTGFTASGIPWALGFLAVVAESAGAIALFAGFLGRVAAAGIGCVMVVAAYTHLPYGFFMNWFGDKAAEGFEFHLLAITIALSVVVEGSGMLSIDRTLMNGGPK